MWCSGLEYSERRRLQVSTLKHQKNRILSRGTIVFGENISKYSEIKLIPTASLSITDPEHSHTSEKQNKVDGTLRNWNITFHEDTEVSKTSTLKTIVSYKQVTGQINKQVFSHNTFLDLHHTRGYVHVGTCVWVPTVMCTWRPQVDSSVLLRHPTPLLTQVLLVNWLDTKLQRLACFDPCYWVYTGSPMHSFYVDARNQNSVSHAFVESISAVPIWPFSQSILVYLLKKDLH